MNKLARFAYFFSKKMKNRQTKKGKEISVYDASPPSLFTAALSEHPSLTKGTQNLVGNLSKGRRTAPVFITVEGDVGVELEGWRVEKGESELLWPTTRLPLVFVSYIDFLPYQNPAVSSKPRSCDGGVTSEGKQQSWPLFRSNQITSECRECTCLARTCVTLRLSLSQLAHVFFRSSPKPLSLSS